MALPDDREQLRRSFVAIFVEHPVITLLAAMFAGALVFAMYLDETQASSNCAATSIRGFRLFDQADRSWIRKELG